MTENKPTHSGAERENLEPNLQQTFFRPGKKITHQFTKNNPQDWFGYFEKLCEKYGIINDK